MPKLPRKISPKTLSFNWEQIYSVVLLLMCGAPTSIHTIKRHG